MDSSWEKLILKTEEGKDYRESSLLMLSWQAIMGESVGI